MQEMVLSKVKVIVSYAQLGVKEWIQVSGTNLLAIRGDAHPCSLLLVFCQL